jgi:hypothetical protein
MRRQEARRWASKSRYRLSLEGHRPGVACACGGATVSRMPGERSFSKALLRRDMCIARHGRAF